MEKSLTLNRIDPNRIDHIEVRGARVHNLKNVDVDIPLGELVGVIPMLGADNADALTRVLALLAACWQRLYGQARSAKRRHFLVRRSPGGNQAAAPGATPATKKSLGKVAQPAKKSLGKV